MSARPDNHFDRVAGSYDGLARLVFGDRLQTAQNTWLDRIPADSDIAIIGGGSGELLEAMAETVPEPRAIHYIDASPRMIELAGERADQQPSSFAEIIHFIPQALDQWHAARPVDVLITPFLLDCFDGEQLEQTIEHLGEQLRPGGLWLVTDFTPSKRMHHRLTMAMMFGFFRLSAALASKQLEPYFELIERLGFEAIEQCEIGTIAGPVRASLFAKATCCYVWASDATKSTKRVAAEKVSGA